MSLPSFKEGNSIQDIKFLLAKFLKENKTEEIVQLVDSELKDGGKFDEIFDSAVKQNLFCIPKTTRFRKEDSELSSDAFVARFLKEIYPSLR